LAFIWNLGFVIWDFGVVEMTINCDEHCSMMQEPRAHMNPCDLR